MAQKDRDMKKQAKWSRAYNEKSYDRLYPFVPKGKKAEIQAAAEEQGETINEFIVKAIEERMSRFQPEKPFIPPQGEFCSPNCKKRGAKITGPRSKRYDLMISDGIPWCYAHVTELEWKDKEAGICFKCEKCKEESAKRGEMTEGGRMSMPDAGKDLIGNHDRMIEAVWRAIVGSDTPKKGDGELTLQGQSGPVTVYHFMYKGEEAAAMTIKEVFPGRFSYFIQPESVKLLDVMEKIKEVAMEEYGEEDKIWLQDGGYGGNTQEGNCK